MKCSVEAASPYRVNAIAFNQQQQFFAVGTNQGFYIFSCEPFKLHQHKEFQGDGGIGVVEMLFQTNILALVGGGRAPRWPPNEVKLWDAHQGKELGFLTFKHQVKSVQMRRDFVVVILEESVVLHRFDELTAVQTIQTARNPKGLCALAPGSTAALACPGPEEGSINVVTITENKQHLIRKAHDSAIAALAVNLSATRVASASLTGTLIRVFDTRTGRKLQELRRGVDSADICSLAFNHTSHWLCAASDKGTVHIFNVAESCTEGNASGGMRLEEAAAGPEDDEQAANPTSSLAWIGDYLPLPTYFNSEWSFAQFQLPPVPRVCAFGNDGTSIYAVGEDGLFYHGRFDPKDGGAVELLTKEVLFE